MNYEKIKGGGYCDYCKVFIKFSLTKYVQCPHCTVTSEVKNGI